MYARQLTLARQYRERSYEATSYGALGLANRLMKKFDKALGYHTQELTLRQEICDMLGKEIFCYARSFNFTAFRFEQERANKFNLVGWHGIQSRLAYQKHV